MTVAFPLTPAPSGYRNCSFPSNRSGVFYVGQTPVVTLSAALAAGVTYTYTVRDFYGTSVSTGSLSVGATTVTPTAPVGGWLPGWYRVYLNSSASDALFGTSVGATSFCVIKSDAHFPTMPSTATSGGAGGESRDLATKGIMGLGTSRLLIGDVTALAAGADSLAVVQADVSIAKTYWSAPGSPYADASRPRPLWTNFPNGAFDSFPLTSGAGGSGDIYGRVYCADETIDGSGIFIAVAAGGVSGVKITVRAPDASTIVETYDNITSLFTAETTINAASSRVRLYATQADLPATRSATAIGRDYYDGVVEVVNTIYPDVENFEGPINEPTLGAGAAHQMRLFAGAVHAGHPSARAIGPCPVDISNLTDWAAFLDAGGGDHCDALSFHDYNSQTNGSLPQGRAQVEAFLELLEEHGLGDVELWQTEAGAAFTPVYGVHHPRRARVKMLHAMLWEQYGLPRERNSYWYDVSHGFWSFPTWFENADGSLAPEAVLFRTMAEETWGKPYASALDFGYYGNRIFLGNVYGTTDKTIAVMTTSAMPDATVTFKLTGDTEATTVTAFGVEDTLTADDFGNVAMAVGEVPTYLRVPDGVTATLVRCNDWPLASTIGAWANGTPATTGSLDGAVRATAGNDAWPTTYDGTFTGYALAPAALSGHSTADFQWQRAGRFDRVLIWAGQAWQGASTLIDFDVQTSNDGSAWTTQATVTKTTPSSFVHGTNSTNVGCQRETFWDEQWVFDVKLDDPVTAKYMRLYVRSVSYGGEPDAASVTTGGQGDAAPRLALMEVAVLCDDNATPLPVQVPVPPFDPTSISGLSFWFDASQIALADGDPVPSWSDASGNGHTLAQATSGSRPTLRTSGAGLPSTSAPVVEFDGVDDFISGGLDGIDPPVPIASVFIVFRVDTRVDYMGVLTAQVGSGYAFTSDEVVAVWIGGSVVSNYERDGIATTSYSTDGTWHVYSATQSSATLLSLLLGRDRNNAGRYLDGAVAEVIGYDRVLTTDERAEVTEGMRVKYGTP